MKHILAAALLLGTTALAGAQGFPNLAYGTPAGCLYQPAGQTIAVGSFGYVQCGAAGELQVGVTGSATATFGAAPAIAGSAASGVVIKASAGNLYSAYATSTAAAWLMVFNSATVPTNGATTAGIAAGNMVECIPLAAQGATNFYAAINYAPGPGELFTTGISAALSSTACATLTLATTGFIHGLAR